MKLFRVESHIGGSVLYLDYDEQERFCNQYKQYWKFRDLMQAHVPNPWNDFNGQYNEEHRFAFTSEEGLLKVCEPILNWEKVRFKVLEVTTALIGHSGIQAIYYPTDVITQYDYVKTTPEVLPLWATSSYNYF